MTLSYLREIKAYHFKNSVEDYKGPVRIGYSDICKCFHIFFDFLLTSSHEGIKKLKDLRMACDTLIGRLASKGEQDEKLKDDQLYLKTVKSLKEEFRIFKSKVYKIEGVIDQRYYENF